MNKHDDDMGETQHWFKAMLAKQQEKEPAPVKEAGSRPEGAMSSWADVFKKPTKRHYRPAQWRDGAGRIVHTRDYF